MNWLKYVVVNVIETLLRMLPLPCKTGVLEIGHPDRQSPVFLTCNYHLTVARVRRALQEMDCYLLVANSRGVNVWCSATGGLFTNHDVISALKTSGIEQLLDHRNVVLPQLAATGVESQVIKQKAGWKVIWGPVYAKDIPLFVENGFNKSPQMRQVEFPLAQRLEMAIAWAFPISAVVALVALPLWRQALLSLLALVWGLSLLIFVTFPFYRRWLSSEGKRLGVVFFDFGHGGIQLILWALLMLALGIYSMAFGQFTWGLYLRWGLFTFVIVLLVSIDLMGSTPVYKSGLQEDRFLHIVLDEDKCKGAAYCEQVCPRNCYEVDQTRHAASIVRPDRCVQCGACIVQCPFDALCFQSPNGAVVLPETVRRFKLSLMGKRLARVGGE
jgi:NAD-dependent dihydropyrimidine dehydrogenase PreA subunit